MLRREFIAGLGSAAAWPVVARAQQADRVRRVGVLRLEPVYDQFTRTSIAALREGLEVLGWNEGRNLQLDIRFAGGDPNAVGPYADELVNFAPSVIVVSANIVTTSVQRRTRTIPIVFVGGGDPVAGGLVKSLAHPEGNTTGITNLFPSMGGKWLELLRGVAPRVARVALLFNPELLRTTTFLADAEAAAAASSVKAIRTPYFNATELERAVEAFAAEPNGAAMVLPPGIFGTNRDLLFRLAVRHRLPAIYQSRAYTVAGGLMSYGSNGVELYRQSASYVDRILRGAKPGELPVQFPEKFEWVVNLKTAKDMALDIPPTLRSRADEVIE
jgi:putative tryptophan/tyrosine transport system substrate-binding protein